VKSIRAASFLAGMGRVPYPHGSILACISIDEVANMLRIGLVGVGFMGWIHYLAYKQTPGVALSAVSTRDPKRLAGDWRGIQGNFGPPGEQIDLSSVATYSDWRELIKDVRVDVVDICLPPYLHAEVATAALQAGKHVLCEKPLGLTAEECDAMVSAAGCAGRQLYAAHVLPFLPEYAKAREIIASAQYGKPLGGHFRRVISDPLWLKDFYDPARVGGPLVDLHVHDAHFIRLLFGMPSAVMSQGRMRGESVEYCNTLFQFAERQLAVSASSGVINQQGRPFIHGFEIHLERATLFFEFGVLADNAGNLVTPLTLLTGDGKVVRPELPAGDPMLAAFAAELAEMASCAATNRPSPLLGGDLARDAVVLCHRQTEAVRTGKVVKV
jgi:predicted dehydrogenase